MGTGKRKVSDNNDEKFDSGLKFLESIYGFSFEEIKSELINRYYSFENSYTKKLPVLTGSKAQKYKNVVLSRLLQNSDLFCKSDLFSYFKEYSSSDLQIYFHLVDKSPFDFSRAEWGDGLGYDKEYELLKLFCPTKQMSKYYHLLFSLTCLFFCVKNGISGEELKKLYLSNVGYSDAPSMALLALGAVRIHTDNADGPVIDLAKSLFMESKSLDSVDSDYSKYVYLSILILSCGLLFGTKKEFNREELLKDAISKVQLVLASFYKITADYDTAIKYSTLAIMSENAYCRKMSFNLLGLSAYNCRRYQLAYDAYFSWIRSSLPEVIRDELKINKVDYNTINTYLTSEEEEKWRRENPQEVAIMIATFAVLCSLLAQECQQSVTRKNLLVMSDYCANLSNIILPNRDAYFIIGVIAKNEKKYVEAYDAFYMAYKMSENEAKQVIALGDCLSVCGFLPNDLFNEKFNLLSDLFIEKYNKVIQISKEDPDNEDYSYARNSGLEYFNLVNSLNTFPARQMSIRRAMMQIDNDVRETLRCLQQRFYSSMNLDLHIEHCTGCLEGAAIGMKKTVKEEIIPRKTTGDTCKNIAYYTTLDNLKFLFSEVDNDETKTSPFFDSEKGADSRIEVIKKRKTNCLTMMHARYMNDPDEGLILFRHLSEYLPLKPEDLRDLFYDQKYVFLKSFTGLVDQLNMWTLYGSSKDNGSDCNGCCVCLAPESFNPITVSFSSEESKISARSDDDFNLYKVAYMDGDKILVDGVRNTELEKKVSLLTEHLKVLKKVSDRSKNKKAIENSLVRILAKIMFLFKDSSYQMEAERRLIISREINSSSCINKTKQNPPKLFIYPSLQVYPEKIILGPKVEKTDNWMPYIQHELSKIKDKWIYSDERDYNPIVRVSKINIR